MTIERNGKQIELTASELRRAYYEQEKIWDMNYIKQDLPDLYNDEGTYDEEIERLQNDEEFCEAVAYRYRKYLEDQISCDTEWDCFRDAYRYVTECSQ